MVLCPRCGKDSEGAWVCDHCGAEIRKEPEEVPTLDNDVPYLKIEGPFSTKTETEQQFVLGTWVMIFCCIGITAFALLKGLLTYALLLDLVIAVAYIIEWRMWRTT